MDNSSFNAKMEPSLRAAIDVDNSDRITSGDLGTGFNADTQLWELILFYSGNSATLQAAFPDLTFTFLLSNYAIVRLPAKAIDTLAASPQIIYIERPRRLFYEVLAAKRASCITPLQQTGASTQNLTGSGTLLCVIDSGIDYTHPDFRNPDGTTRIVSLWDQTIAPDPSRGFFSPSGYSLGTLFTEE